MAAQKGFVISKRNPCLDQGTRRQRRERRSAILEVSRLARQKACLGCMKGRQEGRKEVSKSVGRKKRSFVGQSEERERKENGKESGERTRAGAGQRRVGREKG